jgi:hypothetical protein
MKPGFLFIGVGVMTIVSSALFPSASGARTRGNNVWIAVRTDGLPGSGTVADPYDGSTEAKLDPILRGLANGTVVHFGPGTFLSKAFQDGSSSVGFSVKPGCRYIGAGRDLTTFRITSVIATNTHLAAVFFIGSNADVSGASVENMTIDANGTALVAANSADMCTYGVSLPGSRNTIRNVRLIGMYGHEATGREAFGLGTPPSATNPTPRGNLIEGCLVDSFATGNDHGQMICINGGTARDNLVVGQTTNSSAYQAYGKKAILENCRSINCKTFLYMDTGDVSNLVVNNCRAWGLTNRFVSLAQSTGFTHHDVTVKNCTVEFDTSSSQPIFFHARANGPSDPSHLYNLSAFNNTCTQKGSGNYIPFDFYKVSNFIEKRNRWLGNPRRQKTSSPPRKAHSSSTISRSGKFSNL